MIVELVNLEEQHAISFQSMLIIAKVDIKVINFLYCEN